MSKKYIVERPITVRSNPVVLTDDQLSRRDGLVKPAQDDEGNDIEGAWVPIGSEGIQFKQGEVVEFHDEAEKVLLSTGQLREASDEEVEEHLHQREEARAKANLSPSEFQRRPVPDRSGSPNAVDTSGPVTDQELQKLGLSRQEFDALNEDQKADRTTAVQQERKKQAEEQARAAAQTRKNVAKQKHGGRR